MANRKIIVFIAVVLLMGFGVFVLYFLKDTKNFIELSNTNSTIINIKPSASSIMPIATTTSAVISAEIPYTISVPLVNDIKADFSDLSGQLVKHLFNINSVASPKGAAFSPNGQEIWVTLLLNKSRGVAVFDSNTGKNIANINLENGGGVEIIFSKDGSMAYISQMETAQIFEINVLTKKVLRVLKTQGNWTKEMDFSADGKSLFASNWVSNTITEINLETDKIIRQIPTVKTPRGVYATANGSFLYVAGFDKGEIQKIDLQTGQGKVIYKTNGAMRHIVADESREVLYVSDMGTASIFKVDMVTDVVKKFATTDINPNTIALSPDKKTLFVSCRGVNATADNYYIPGPEWGSVLLFDTQTGNMLDAIIGGNQPTALAVSPNGQTLVFSDFLDNRLQVFQVPEYGILLAGAGGLSGTYKAQLKK